MLESVFDLKGTFHFTLHLSLHEGTPNSLGKEVITHGQLVRVSVLAGSRLSNYLLFLNAEFAPFNRLSFVGNRLFK